MHLDALSAAQLGEQLGAKERKRLDDTGGSPPTTIEAAKALCERLLPPPIAKDQVEYEDGTPQTVDQYARDVASFMMWAAEPKLEERKRTGFMVMIFLLGLAVLVWLTKRSITGGAH